jgi:hypothetical protein
MHAGQQAQKHAALAAARSRSRTDVILCCGRGCLWMPGHPRGSAQRNMRVGGADRHRVPRPVLATAPRRGAEPLRIRPACTTHRRRVATVWFSACGHGSVVHYVWSRECGSVRRSARSVRPRDPFVCECSTCGRLTRARSGACGSRSMGLRSSTSHLSVASLRESICIGTAVQH